MDGLLNCCLRPRDGLLHPPFSSSDRAIDQCDRKFPAFGGIARSNCSARSPPSMNDFVLISLRPQICTHEPRAVKLATRYPLVFAPSVD